MGTLYWVLTLVVASKGELQEAGQGPLNNEQIVNVYIMKIGTPREFPWFKGASFAPSGTPFSFKVPYGTLREDLDFNMGKDVDFFLAMTFEPPAIT